MLLDQTAAKRPVSFAAPAPARVVVVHKVVAPGEVPLDLTAAKRQVSLAAPARVAVVHGAKSRC